MYRPEELYLCDHFVRLHEEYGLHLDTPIEDLSADMNRNCLFYGGDGKSAQGQIQRSERRRRHMTLYRTALWTMLNADTRRLVLIRQRQSMSSLCAITPCTSCKGQRLKKPSSLAVTVADKNIYEMTSMSVKELVKFLA